MKQYQIGWFSIGEDRKYSRLVDHIIVGTDDIDRLLAVINDNASGVIDCRVIREI